jgi:hypothetical protein
MSRIERSDILASEFLHQAGYGAYGWRCRQQMHMVAHQYISMQFDVGVEQGFMEVLEIAPAVAVIKETREAVVAALNDMLGYAG